MVLRGLIVSNPLMAVMPSISGIFTSISTTSACDCGTCASLPLATTLITYRSGSRSNCIRSPHHTETGQRRSSHPLVSSFFIVSKKRYYVVEVVYEQAIKLASTNPAFYAGIDLGINNLATVASYKAGFVPVNVNGRLVKSINLFYNKRRADLQKKLGHTGTTKRMERLTNMRNRRIDHYLQTASSPIIALLV